MEENIIYKENDYYFKIQYIAMGLHIIKVDKKKNKAYIRVDYPRINKYLLEGGYKQINKKSYINLQTVLYLYDKTKCIEKNKFIDNICSKINISKPIVHLSKRFETSFFDILEEIIHTLEPKDKKFMLLRQVYTKDKKYRVDFYIPEIQLIVEYDEEHHKLTKQKQNDKIRDEYMKDIGIKTIRVIKGKEGEGIGKIIKYIINDVTCNQSDSDYIFRDIFSSTNFYTKENYIEDINREVQLHNYKEIIY